MKADSVCTRFAGWLTRRARSAVWLLHVLLAFSVELSSPGAGLQKICLRYSNDSEQVPLPVRQQSDPKLWLENEPGPVPGLKCFAREGSGAIWLGGEQGAARYDPHANNRWERWQYFFGPRWLLDNQVQN